MKYFVRGPRALPFLVSIFIAALAFAGCAYALVHNGQLNQAKADQIESGIQEIRQLKFTAKVPVVVKDSNQVSEMMASDLAQDYSDERLRLDGTAGILVGLFPMRFDLKSETLKLLKNQVAGFYDPHGKEMVLVEGGVDIGFLYNTAQLMIQRDVVGEMLLAHELTHALQDQHFEIDKRLDALKENDDRLLALKSVAEGDATIAGFAYTAGAMSNETADKLIDNIDEIPQAFAAQTPGAPEGLSVPLLFQYTQGARFVREAYRRGGWAAVDALYRDPPQSSHQVMHSEFYFGHRVDPAKISIDGYQHIMVRWTKGDDDSYGELLLRVILERGLGKNAPELAIARQWSGDRMIILQQGRAVTVIWMLSFSDAQAASHFAAVYSSILDRLLGSSAAHRVDYQCNAALVIVGEGANYFNALAPAIWGHSSIDGHPAVAPGIHQTH
ncbi:MAG TPA: hypothetical protein VIX12_02425 [Candidatus Binataceae bacterium]